MYDFVMHIYKLAESLITHVPEADNRLRQAPYPPWVCTLPTLPKHPPHLIFCRTHLTQAPYPRQRERRRASGRGQRSLEGDFHLD